MITIKFIGDPKDGFHGAKVINFYGLTLKKGQAVRCSDPKIIAKAEASNHFKVKGGKEVFHGPDGE